MWTPNSCAGMMGKERHLLVTDASDRRTAGRREALQSFSHDDVSSTGKPLTAAPCCPNAGRAHAGPTNELWGFDTTLPPPEEHRTSNCGGQHQNVATALPKPKITARTVTTLQGTTKKSFDRIRPKRDASSAGRPMPVKPGDHLEFKDPLMKTVCLVLTGRIILMTFTKKI